MKKAAIFAMVASVALAATTSCVKKAPEKPDQNTTNTINTINTISGLIKNLPAERGPYTLILVGEKLGEYNPEEFDMVSTVVKDGSASIALPEDYRGGIMKEVTRLSDLWHLPGMGQSTVVYSNNKVKIGTARLSLCDKEGMEIEFWYGTSTRMDGDREWFRQTSRVEFVYADGACNVTGFVPVSSPESMTITRVNVDVKLVKGWNKVYVSLPTWGDSETSVTTTDPENVGFHFSNLFD